MYLIDSDKEAIDFDLVSEALTKELKVQKPKSVDCLYVEAEKLFLVEFKNQKKINKDDIKLKIYDSLSLLNYFYKLDEGEIIEMIIVRKGNAPTSTAVEISSYLNVLADSHCPTWLKFIEQTHRVKISMIYQDEYFKQLD